MSLNKKAMELPISAIVVAIIALTFLGLALYFMSTYWGKTSERLGAQINLVTEQMAKTLEQTGEIIAFDFGRSLEVKKGAAKDILIGLRNGYVNIDPSKRDVCFKLQIKCIQAMSEGNKCSETANNIIIGGAGVQPQNNWFTRMISTINIENKKFFAFPATIQTASVNEDRYVMEAELSVAEPKTECETTTNFKYTESKRFIIDIT